MHRTVYFNDLNRIDFKDAWDFQEELFNRNIEIKKQSNKSLTETTKNYLLICEHPHVYTLGKSGKANNLLVDENFLSKIGADYFEINRGGDITYHGIGQIVVYPILDLENFKIGLKKYIYNLEEIVIMTLLEYGIKSTRIPEATGVWIYSKTINIQEKICAIGVRSSRFITMHGLAFNINTDLKYFNYINPCGFTNKGVTSLKKELGKEVHLSEVVEKLIRNFITVFKIDNLIALNKKIP